MLKNKTHVRENELENKLEIEENNVQSLMHQMNVDDIVASDYTNIDNRIEVADIINEGDIIATQKVPKKEDGEAKREECNTVSNMSALNSVFV